MMARPGAEGTKSTFGPVALLLLSLWLSSLLGFTYRCDQFGCGFDFCGSSDQVNPGIASPPFLPS